MLGQRVRECGLRVAERARSLDAGQVASSAATVLANTWPALLVGSLLVLWGIGWRLDHPMANYQSWQADENASLYAIRHIRPPTFSTAPWLPWGTGLFYQVFALKTVVTLGGAISASPWEVLLLGRLVVWASAMGAIGMTYVIGRRLFGNAVGRLAALLLAVTPGFVINSHYLKVEIPMVCWLLIAVWACLNLIEHQSMGWCVGAAALVGYAASVQYSGAIGIAALVTGVVLSPRLDRRRVLRLAPPALVVAFLFGTPYAAITPIRWEQAVRWVMHLNRMGQPYTVSRPPALIDYPLHVFPLAFTVPLIITATIGAALATHRLGRRLLPIWAVVAAHFALMSFDNQRLVRYTVVLAPFVALFAAQALVSIGIRRLFRIPAGMAAIAVFAVALLFASAYVRGFGERDPRAQALSWLEGHAAPGSEIAISTEHPLDVPQTQQVGYRPVEVGRTVAGLEANPGHRYLVISDYPLLWYEQAISHYPQIQAFLAAVRRDYCQVATFENQQKLFFFDAVPRHAKLSQDWLHPNPRITILERRALTPGTCTIFER